MNALISGIVIDALATALSVAGGWFVVKGWITPEQSATFQTAAALRAAQYLALVGPAALQAYLRYRASLRQLAIHQLPANADEGAIRIRMLSLGLRDVLGGRRSDLARRLARLEAWAEDINAERAARSLGPLTPPTSNT